MASLFYSSSLSLLVLFSCFLEKIHSKTTDICFHVPASVCSPAYTASSLRNLDSLRKSLVRQEDSIVFCLIERSKYPMNSPMYDDKGPIRFDLFIKESEAVQAKAGRYTSEEENAFFPDNLPQSTQPPLNCTQVLHRPGACININDQILEMYRKWLLPLIAAEGDDGNYASTATSDLNCLQALSRRIHSGKFVAEAKFKGAPKNYTPAIRAKDKEALVKLLTVKSVEKTIKKRVAKKAKIFGQDVDHQENGTRTYKVDPSVVSRLYGEQVINLTKFVEVEYLLQRL